MYSIQNEPVRTSHYFPYPTLWRHIISASTKISWIFVLFRADRIRKRTNWLTSKILHVELSSWVTHTKFQVQVRKIYCTRTCLFTSYFLYCEYWMVFEKLFCDNRKREQTDSSQQNFLRDHFSKQVLHLPNFKSLDLATLKI